ncbi:MAG: DAK2 domain-containing protein [Clostridiales bacterium]|nr:DAK2 domain-containing protein [Clostridiales bacterium]
MCELIGAEQVRNGLRFALRNLKSEKDNLNALNLYPVADKDTGTNLVHSMSLTLDNLPQEDSASAVFKDVSDLLLEYAYGSSGTILNLFFEGFAEGLQDKEYLSGTDLARAFDAGVQRAVYGVEKPENGTILSVGRQSAEAGLSVLEITEDASVVWKRITEEGHAALQLTPTQNPRLKGSGVMDSGAYGLCLILDGFLESFEPEAVKIPYPDLIFPDSKKNGESGGALYRYCTEFVVRLGDIAALEEIKGSIAELGNCFLCASNGDSVKVHIHTNKPEEVLELASKIGKLHSQKIDDMERQML